MDLYQYVKDYFILIHYNIYKVFDTEKKCAIINW